MSRRVEGPFEVTLAPLETHGALSADAAARIGRLSIDKRYSGPLEGTGRGEMLTAGTNTKGSAAYVAIERFTGTLDGRRGGFSLRHAGVATAAAQQLAITIVPDSGTEGLRGIAGTMQIDIVDRKHSYALEFTLPDSR